MNFTNISFMPVAKPGIFCDIPSACVLDGIKAIYQINNYYSFAFYLSLLVYVFVDAFLPLIPGSQEYLTRYYKEIMMFKSIAAFIIVVWCLLLIVYR